MNKVSGALTSYARVSACEESAYEIIGTYYDTNLSKTAKTTQILAQVVFVATQTAEIILEDNISLAPVVNSINGSADLLKTGINAYIRKEDLRETTKKVLSKVVTHSANISANLVKQPAFNNVQSLQNLSSVLCGVSAVISIANAYYRFNKILTNNNE